MPPDPPRNLHLHCSHAPPPPPPPTKNPGYAPVVRRLLEQLLDRSFLNKMSVLLLLLLVIVLRYRLGPLFDCFGDELYEMYSI